MDLKAHSRSSIHKSDRSEGRRASELQRKLIHTVHTFRVKSGSDSRKLYF